MFPTCEAEILHTTTNLKASTSEGFDNISTKIITMNEVATPLAHVVNYHYLTAYSYRNDMKLAQIAPMFKNRNTKLFDSRSNLFLIYINDISNSTELNLSFADDTTIYCSETTLDDNRKKSTSEVTKILDWLHVNSHDLV